MKKDLFLGLVIVFALIVTITEGEVSDHGNHKKDNSQPIILREFVVDFSKPIGAIKHLHDLHGGPISFGGWVDSSSYFKKLGIKHIRLHGVLRTFYRSIIDVSYIFPDFEADANLPENYEFKKTDEYLKLLEPCGFDITYRLGNSHAPKRFNRACNFPPADFNKWAKICVNIARHYNDGWANGYHYNIKYWEIWNEPDLQSFWKGTIEEYFQLYDITARALKKYDPELKVGGPAIAGTIRHDSYFGFMEDFLKYCKKHHAPLDFYSWHMYRARPYELCERAIKTKELLDKYGFTNAESHLDEWNYFPGDWELFYSDPRHKKGVGAEIGGMAGASFAASALIYLQDGNLDVATYYQGGTLVWDIFDSYGIPRKNFYAFKALSLLMKTPQRVFCEGSDPNGLAAIAGMSADKSTAIILISNFATKYNQYSINVKNLPWQGKVILEKYILDTNHNLDLVETENPNSVNFMTIENVETPSVYLIKLIQQ